VTDRRASRHIAERVTHLRQTDPVRASDAHPTAYDFTAPLYEWTGPAAWHFVTVPVAISDEIDARTHGLTNGFGSVRVRVRIGGSEWATSLFPDSKQQAYVLPVKKAVRQAEALSAGDEARVHLELVDVS
jgi:Domain of unknown function (DUF1905)